jgi:threonyl-tRNA synthetase
MEQPQQAQQPAPSKPAEKNASKAPKQPKAAKKAAPVKKIDISKLEKPEFIAHRLKVWDEYKQKIQAEAKGILKSIKIILAEDKTIKVTLPDGKVIDGVAMKTTPFDIAMGISKGLVNSSVAAKVKKLRL